MKQTGHPWGWERPVRSPCTFQAMNERPRVQIRPVGGLPGCLGMILFSVVASIVLTLLLNMCSSAATH